MSAAYSIGTDAEFFVTQGEEITSAIGLIGGSKEEPLLVDKGNLQEDNILAEFAADPAHSLEEWEDNISAVHRQLIERLEQDGYSLAMNSAAKVNKSLLKHPMARRFGCETDYNAYTMQPNESPNPRIVGRTRVAGGHVHVGYEGITNELERADFVRIMDVFMAAPAVVFTDSLGNSKEEALRRTLYGQAGSYRPKTYGVEYRTLSNFWVSDKDLRKWVYNSVADCISQFEKDPLLTEDRMADDFITYAINNNNAGMAREIMQEFRVSEVG